MSGAADKVLFSYGPTERGRARGLWIVNEQRLCFYFWGHPADLHCDIKGGITPDQWHHVAATYDGTTARLYYDGTFLLERILGTVPVEADGSAHIELPAMRALFFVALDENDMSGFQPQHEWVREMQRYGMLPPSLDDAAATIDVYQLERKYWQSQWYRPAE